MTHENFKKLLEELDGNAFETLAEKNTRYSSSDDALHNFKAGAEIMGSTPTQACWGYLTKHLTALRDMIQRDDFSNHDDFLEKCQDVLNYIRFIWALGNESKNNQSSCDTEGECDTCYYSDNKAEDEPCCKCKNSAIEGSDEYNKRPLLYKRI